eukprot:4464475-Prymnesium_polylepis.1
MRRISARVQDQWIRFIRAHTLPWPRSGRGGEPHVHVTEGRFANVSAAPPKTRAGLKLARRLYCDREALRDKLVAACACAGAA